MATPSENDSKWLSCYIFHDILFEKAIVELMAPLTERLTSEDRIDQFFFIRYWENGPHLRLRVHLKRIQEKGQIMKIIEQYAADYFRSLAKPPVSYSIAFNDYIQEIQRYGGKHTIAISEIHFEDSSKMTAQLIQDHFAQWDYATALSLAIQMHLIFAKATLTSMRDARLFYHSFFRNWLGHSLKKDKNGQTGKAALFKLLSAFEKSYQTQKSKMDRLVQIIWQHDLPEEWMTYWYNCCGRLQALIKAAQNERKIAAPGWYDPAENASVNPDTQIVWSIYESYVHMTNNRLGIYLRDEAFIAYLIYCALNSRGGEVRSTR